MWAGGGGAVGGREEETEGGREEETEGCRGKTGWGQQGAAGTEGQGEGGLQACASQEGMSYLGNVNVNYRKVHGCERLLTEAKARRGDTGADNDKT